MPAVALSRNFDHTLYRDELTRRWGQETYQRTDGWWRSLGLLERLMFAQQQRDIALEFADAAREGLLPDEDHVQAITRRLFDWADQAVPVTPEYFLGLADMYARDARFSQNFERHHPGTARLVYEAMVLFVHRHLQGVVPV